MANYPKCPTCGAIGRIGEDHTPCGCIPPSQAPRTPIPCGHCGEIPVGIAVISVNYNSPRKQGVQSMMRVACQCGAIGKCRLDAQSAIEAWNEPWQALVL